MLKSTVSPWTFQFINICQKQITSEELLILETVSCINLNGQPYSSETLYKDKYLIIIKNPNVSRNKIYNSYENNELNKIERRFKNTEQIRAEIKQQKLLKTQQERKVKEINDFMADHYLTTNYLYDEVQRIKQQRMVKDDLRKMVEYLQKPEAKNVRAQVMKCYRDSRKREKVPDDKWAHDTNNLVVNIIRDPYNFGYIN